MNLLSNLLRSFSGFPKPCVQNTFKGCADWKSCFVTELFFRYKGDIFKIDSILLSFFLNNCSVSFSGEIPGFYCKNLFKVAKSFDEIKSSKRKLESHPELATFLISLLIIIFCSRVYAISTTDSLDLWSSYVHNLIRLQRQMTQRKDNESDAEYDQRCSALISRQTRSLHNLTGMYCSLAEDVLSIHIDGEEFVTGDISKSTWII